MPGKDPGGFLATVAIGIIGALFGGMLGRMVGMYGQDDPVGFVMAVHRSDTVSLALSGHYPSWRHVNIEMFG